MQQVCRHGWTAALCLAATLLSSVAVAQLSVPGRTNSSTADGNSNGANNSWDRQSTLTQVSSSGSVFEVRYASQLSCDSGAFGGNDTRTLASDYTITFNALATVGYYLDVATRRTGGVDVRYDGGLTGGESDITALTGTLSNATFVSGTLGLADPTGGAPDCDINGANASSCSINVNQMATARYYRLSNGVLQAHSLHFTWSQTTFTAAASGHEASVRMGIQSRDSSNDASLYAGTPARNNQANDGHFVKVTFTSACGNGVLDTGEQCDTGVDNGTGTSCCTGSCQFRGAGQSCRPVSGDCDVAEVCTGTIGFCPGNAVVAINTVCRPATGACDYAETCNGSFPACPPDVVLGTNVVCRTNTAGEQCDVDETCDGVNPVCPLDEVKPMGVGCRNAAGVCDVAEVCTGASRHCPVDGFAPSSTLCRGAAGVCDVADNCSGSSAACPADAKSTAQCRAASGACDMAETCDGVGNACPTDVVKPNGSTCRAAAGSCDLAETCNGVSTACPTDVLKTNGTQCRAAVAFCDLAESCDGVGSACPADAVKGNGVECRAAAGVCDVAESCDGSSGACPADVLAADNSSCSDGAFCNGTETCQAGTCTNGALPCISTCDEGTDVCTGICPPNPQATCRGADRSALQIRNNADNSRDSLTWRWSKGAATTQMEFGDPTVGATYALCLYSGITSVAEIQVPASPTFWSPLGTKGYKYRDVASLQDGAQKITLKSGLSGRAKALVKGRGINLPDPINAGPLTLPVTVQLVNDGNGLCWQSVFTNASKNLTTQFKAKAP
ncbi:MAG: hypothetical protein ABI629_09195 [bacterium]